MEPIGNFNEIVITDPAIKICDKNEVHEFDIDFRRDKNCDSSLENPHLSGTTISANCYLARLTKKMISVRRSRRKDFIDYQVNQQENQGQWLKEVDDMIIDYEDRFNKNGFTLAGEYREIIRSKLFELNQNIEPESYDKSPTSVQEMMRDENLSNIGLTYQLPEDFKLINENIKAERLDIYQAAILFYYLRKHKALINYSDSDLAKFVHYLTGHSEQNLRTTKGFGSIWKVMNADRNREPAYNLKAVKALLVDILQDIDQKLEGNT